MTAHLDKHVNNNDNRRGCEHSGVSIDNDASSMMISNVNFTVNINPNENYRFDKKSANYLSIPPFTS